MKLETEHVPVLIAEVLEFLSVEENEKESFFLDCTLGGGGHTKALLGKNKNLFAFSMDQDPAALLRAEKQLLPYKNRCQLIEGNFGQIKMIFDNNVIQEKLVGSEKKLGYFPKFDRILLDLGISSDQLNDSERGFSFRMDGPLDMRMSPGASVTAEEVVNTSEPRALKRIFLEGGLNSREASSLTHEIVNTRPHSSTHGLAEACRRALRKVKRKKAEGSDLATVPFQAIRIAVNEEFANLKSFLKVAPKILSAQGRIAVISFHSTEDRIVTSTFRSWQQGEEMPAGLPIRGDSSSSLGKLLTKKAVSPSATEIQANSRSRSARLRCFERGDL